MFTWKRYLLAFVITLGIFASAFWISNYFSNKKLADVKAIQDKISVDILSSETEYALLSELSCKDVSNTVLSKEIGSLAEKITYSEENIGNTEQVQQLKKFYSLLQIKDYLLMQKIADRCGVKTVSILYFYTTKDNCSECTKQGYVLTSLRETYPDLRVYSFDYNIDVSAVRALITLYKIDDTKLPAIVLNDKLITGFQSVEEIEKLVPELVKEKAKQEAAAKAVIPAVAK